MNEKLGYIEKESPSKLSESLLPTQGGTIEKNGVAYQFEKVPTDAKVYNPETGKLETRYHSLKTWFSHSTPDVGAGPGWDGRFALNDMPEGEMLQRYGHVFTSEEISSPSGRREIGESCDDELLGGMPYNIPYFDLREMDNENED